MPNLMTTFFGPLDKSACLYFLFISFIFFVALLLILGSEVLYVLTKFDRINLRVISTGVIILFNIFIGYFVNRLLYTMCSKSLA